METQGVQPKDRLYQNIGNSLSHAMALGRRLRNLNTRLLMASIISSAATTLVTAVTAARGPVIGTGPAGWKLSCLLAAIFGFVTTICVAFNQQMRYGDRLAKANECSSRLKALEVALGSGSRGIDEVAKEYEETVRQYPEAWKS